MLDAYLVTIYIIKAPAILKIIYNGLCCSLFLDYILFTTRFYFFYHLRLFSNMGAFTL